MNERFVPRIAPLAVLIAVIKLACQAWSQEVIVALDDASQSAYVDGWQAGDNGGLGFLAWEFDNFFEAAFSPRPEAQFIATNEFVDIPNNGPAFGQTNGNRPYWGYTAWAYRPFATPLQIGQTFSVDLDNPILAPLEPFDPAGVMLRLRDSSKNEKLSLLAQSDFNNADWTVFDAAMESTNTGFSSDSTADGGINFALTLTGTESYKLTLTPLPDGDPLQVSGTFRNPGDPVSEVSLVVFANGSSSDGSREFYANNLRIVEPATGHALVWDGLGDGAWTDLRWTIAGQFPGAADTATIVDNAVTVDGTQSAAHTVVESGRLHVVGQLTGPVEIGEGGAIAGTGTIVGGVTNAGALELDGGTFHATSLENRASGEIFGFGTIVPLIQNSGTVRAAGGTLIPSEGIQAASGTIQIDPDGVLDLSVASINASADLLVHNGADATSLKLGRNSVVVNVDYTNANFGSGDNFQPRAHVVGTGEILASGDVVQQLVGDVSAGDVGNPRLDFGNVHVGTETTLNYRVKNAGTDGPELRGAVQTAVGGNLTDARLNGSGVTAGNYGPVAVGFASSSLTVTFDATRSGPLVGQTVGIVNNFDNVSEQVLSIEGNAWNLAAAEISTGKANLVDLGVVHVDDVAEQGLSISNVAESAGFSERLNASFNGVTGDVVATGSLNLLPAGATDTTNLIVAVDTTTAGRKSGTATIAFVSDGDGTSNLGQTPLTEQQQVVDVVGQVNNFASPAIVVLSGDGELSRESANEYSLDLGTAGPSRGPLTAELGVTNGAAAPADDLAGTFFIAGAPDFMLNGFDTFNGLIAGATQSGLSVAFEPSDLGHVSGVVRLASDSENVSGFSGSLPEITITLTALVTLPGDANGDKYVDAADFNIWNENRGKQNTTWTTGDFNGDGITNELDFTIWSDNKFTSMPLEATVPEPIGALPFVLSTVILVFHFRDSRRAALPRSVPRYSAIDALDSMYRR